MSSAAVIFVLDEILRAREPTPVKRGLMIALGPGFAAEGVCAEVVMRNLWTWYPGGAA